MIKFLRILRFALPYKKYAFLNILFNVLSVLFSLFSITLLAPFLNLLFNSSSESYKKILLQGEKQFGFSLNSLLDYFNYQIVKIIVEQGQMKALILICALVVIMIVLKNTFRYFGMYFIAPIRNGVVRDLRNQVYNKILDLPLSFYSEERKGDLISRMTNDVAEIEWAIMQSLEAVFREPLAIIFFLSTLFYMSAKLTLFVLVLLPLTGVLIARLAKSLKSASAAGKERLGMLISVLEETLSGLRIIKGFNAQPFVRERFFKINDQYNAYMNKIYRRVDLSSPISETMGVISLIIIMLFGGNLVINEGTLSPYVFITYVAVFSQLIDPAKAFTNAYYNAIKGVASYNRIEKIVNAEITITDNPSSETVSGFQNNIIYKNVGFTYQETQSNVLSDVSFVLEKGKTIALVGQSGAGKSTIADMLPRFYDITEGAILLDGKDIRSLRLTDLRNLMGIVTQESILFNDSVYANIAFGLSNVSEELVIKAAQIANAHEFIVQLENGYSTNIGDRGSKLSGGQRQRISIARAVLRNPPILILDEATSALDTESERLVQDALQKLMQNRTTLVIAHRLSTIQHADEILVLHQGKIIERGTHYSLLRSDGQYKKLYDMQAFS